MAQANKTVELTATEIALINAAVATYEKAVQRRQKTNNAFDNLEAIKTATYILQQLKHKL